MSIDTPHILMVDDEPDFEMLIKQKFRKNIRDGEYEFSFASNGAEALELVKKTRGFDIIFTDISMPVMDGLTFLEELRKVEDYIVKAVVISAYGDMEKVRQAMNLGAFDFITKPIDFHDLNITLEKTLREVELLRKGEEARKDLLVAKMEKEKAKQSEQFKQLFLANMSHEIRTPMNAVVGLTDLLLRTSLKDIQKNYLKAIKKSSENLLVILNDILDLSKIEAGKVELDKIPFSLQETIMDVRELMEFKAEEKGLTLEVDIDPELPPVLVGDPARINQVLVNLVANAIKFTEEGSVTLLCKVLEKNKKEVQLDLGVKDTGIGIPKDKLQKIFEDFSQVDSKTAKKYGGTGLGLSISKKLVGLQGGRIKIDSSPGNGSEFIAQIKFPVSTEKEIKNKKEKPGDSNPQMLSGLKLILAEDNDYNQLVAEDTLKSHIENVDISLAKTGKEVIELLEKEDFDLILMDLQMPEMDGYEAAKKIREEFPDPKNKIPIVALTAAATKSETEKCFEVGMNDYISKPFNSENLLLILGKQLKGRVPKGGNNKPDSGKSEKSPDKESPAKNEKSNGNHVELDGTKLVDLTFLQEFSKGRHDRMKKYISMFLTSTPEQLKLMNAGLDEKNYTKVQRAAHSVKPTLKFIGVDKMEELIENIEDYAREEKNLSELPSMISEFGEVCKKVFSELEEELQKFN